MCECVESQIDARMAGATKRDSTRKGGIYPAPTEDVGPFAVWAAISRPRAIKRTSLIKGGDEPRPYPIDPFYEGGCQGCIFPYLSVVDPDIRVPHDAQQVFHPGDDDLSFLISTPLLYF